jgi:hypothetical protein
MRYAKPHELRESVVPVLQLRLSNRQFAEMFPVRTVDLDPLASAEPSRAALVRLNSGSYLVITYGEVSHRAVVEVPRSADPSVVVRELLSEVTMPASAIEWKREDVLPPAQMPRSAAASKVQSARKKTAAKAAKNRTALKVPARQALRVAAKTSKKAKGIKGL